MAGIFSSCKKSDIEYDNQFEKSLNAWEKFKSSSDNSYEYTVSGSSWVGIAWETKIKISAGKIIQRHFKYTSVSGFSGNVPAEALEWTEDETQINSHQNTPAASPLTLDKIYEQAKNEWLIKRSKAQIFFETKNSGLISLCGYVNEGCADDCFRGITITSILPVSPSHLNL